MPASAVVDSENYGTSQELGTLPGCRQDMCIPSRYELARHNPDPAMLYIVAGSYHVRPRYTSP